MARVTTTLGAPARGPLTASKPTSAQNTLPATTTASACHAFEPEQHQSPADHDVQVGDVRRGPHREELARTSVTLVVRDVVDPVRLDPPRPIARRHPIPERFGMWHRLRDSHVILVLRLIGLNTNSC